MNIGNFVRSGDPDTSQFAGQKALAYSPKIQRYVADLMDDGLPRIDEEIAEALNAQGRPHTADAFRHGRKALSDRGLLIATGRTRPTKRGRELATEWVKPMHVVSVRAALEPHLTALAAWRASMRGKQKSEGVAVKCPVHEKALQIAVNGCRDCFIQGEAAQKTLGALVVAMQEGRYTLITPNDILELLNRTHSQSLLEVAKRYV